MKNDDKSIANESPLSQKYINKYFWYEDRGKIPLEFLIMDFSKKDSMFPE